MKKLLFLILAFLLVSCSGYKPVPEYSNDIFAQPVLTKVKMDPEDPDAGIYLQDELSKVAVNRLNLTLTKNVNEAKSYILVNSYIINTTPVNKDDNGNVIRYSVNAAIEFAVKDKYGFWSKNIVANEYVSVKAQSLISALDKEKASKIAINKALDTFVVAVINRSRKVGKHKNELPKYNKQTNNTVNIKSNNAQSIETTTPEYIVQENVENTTNSQNENVFNSNQNETIEQTDTNSDFNVKIIPIDSNEDIIKDATNYN